MLGRSRRNRAPWLCCFSLSCAALAACNNDAERVSYTPTASSGSATPATVTPRNTERSGSMATPLTTTHTEPSSEGASASGPDSDGDGILSSSDLCPSEPEDRDGFEDSDGCPDPDNDRDGIRDVDDQCPNEPEDRDGVRDSDGCPD